jgi:hypothetical protein
MELVARIFDRLEDESDDIHGATVTDAMVIVEVDTGERFDQGPNRPPGMYTVMAKESTTERTTVERGMLDLAASMWDQDDVE